LGNTAPTTTSTIISWIVNENSNNTVFYGINSSAFSFNKVATVINSTPNLELTSLTSSTLYYYIAQSCDQWSLCTNSSLKSFTTDTPSAPSSSSSSGGGGGGGGSSGNADCANGKDDDGDGLIDLNDPGCSSANDDDESNAAVNSLASISSCREDWKCTEWTECSNNVQTRTCQDLNSCDTQFVKPDESKVCTSPEINLAPSIPESQEAVESSSFGSTITGAAIGALGKVKNNGVLVAGLISLTAIAGLVIWKREFFSSKMISKGLHPKQSEEQIQEQMRKGGIIK